MKLFLKIILKVSIATFIIFFEAISFMINNNPEDVKPAIVKWLRFLVNEENIPSFLYSIHSTEQIPFFIYTHKIIVTTLIVYLIYFVYKKVKICSTIRCLYYWLFNFVPSKKDSETSFMSMHDAIAQIINQVDINQLWNEYKFDDYTIYPYLKYKQCSKFELLVVFTLIREGKLILYAHKIIDSGHNYIDTSHLPLQQIPKEFFIRRCDIYNENRWVDNYSAIRMHHGGYEYINISIKSTELDNFIKEHKLTS